jgi:hypothetical protein
MSYYQQSYTEFKQSMSTRDAAPPNPTPAWAHDIEKLRRVVSAKLCQIARRPGTDTPTSLPELAALESQAIKVLCAGAPRCKEYRVALERMQRAGGPLAFLTALAWRRFRLGQQSPTIAADLGVTPCVVRRQAAELALIARRMYPEPDMHLPRAHNAKIEIQPYRRSRLRDVSCECAGWNKGMSFTPQHRARLAAAQQARWAAVRAARHTISATLETSHGKLSNPAV